MRSLLLAVCAFVTLGLAGCASVPVERYRQEAPVLDFSRYFNGMIDGWGMVQDRSGEVTKRFHVVIDARWETKDGVTTGTLDEHFSWADGTTSRRVWTVTRGADGRYVGRASDVVGDAIGDAAGNALHWRYTLALPVDGRVWNVAIDDWMFLIDENVMLNRSSISKFGIHFGDITLSFTRREKL